MNRNLIRFWILCIMIGFGSGLACATNIVEVGDAGSTRFLSQAMILTPGLNTISAIFQSNDDIDFFKIYIPISGLTSFLSSSCCSGAGNEPVMSLFNPDGTLYMVDIYAGSMIAYIPTPGDWYLGMSIYRDYPTRYFPSQMPDGGIGSNNGGVLGDSGALLPGEYAQFKPYSVTVGDSSYKTPNLPPDWHGFDYMVSIETSPVPEPSTLALLGIGLSAIGFTKWRRKR